MSTDIQQDLKDYNADFDNGKSTDANILSLILEQLQEIYTSTKSPDDLPPEIILEFDLSKVNESIDSIEASIIEVANILHHILGCEITYEIKIVYILKTTIGSVESEVQMFTTDESDYVSKAEYVISINKSFMNRYAEFVKTDPHDIEQLILKYYNRNV